MGKNVLALAVGFAFCVTAGGALAKDDEANLEKLGSFFPTPGYCDEEMNFFKASALRPPREDDVAAQPDEDEDIETKAFSLDELRSMIRHGEIIDLKTVAALAFM